MDLTNNSLKIDAQYLAQLNYDEDLGIQVEYYDVDDNFLYLDDVDGYDVWAKLQMAEDNQQFIADVVNKCDEAVTLNSEIDYDYNCEFF